MDFPLALRRWMRLVSIRSASHVSFVLERYAVSAQTLLLLFTAITGVTCAHRREPPRSEEHTSELQSLMRNSYAVFCSKKKKSIHIKSPHSYLVTLDIHSTNTCSYIIRLTSYYVISI